MPPRYYARDYNEFVCPEVNGLVALQDAHGNVRTDMSPANFDFPNPGAGEWNVYVSGGISPIGNLSGDPGSNFFNYIAFDFVPGALDPQTWAMEATLATGKGEPSPTSPGVPNLPGVWSARFGAPLGEWAYDQPPTEEELQPMDNYAVDSMTPDFTLDGTEVPIWTVWAGRYRNDPSTGGLDIDDAQFDAQGYVACFEYVEFFPFPPGGPGGSGGSFPPFGPAPRPGCTTCGSSLTGMAMRNP